MDNKEYQMIVATHLKRINAELYEMTKELAQVPAVESITRQFIFEQVQQLHEQLKDAYFER